MASTPYRPISFSPDEAITDDKINQAMNNVQWLFENTPRMYYNAFGLKKTSGIKILTGVGVVPATKSTLSSTTVYFGTFFSQGCSPVVVATPVRNAGPVRFETCVSGIGQTYPDHRGCRLHISTDERLATSNYHPRALPVNWIAVGW